MPLVLQSVMLSQPPHLATRVAENPPACVNAPPTNSPMPTPSVAADGANATASSLTPESTADQLDPFQRAIRLAETPPARVN
jgi:hypothetical protein